MKKEKHFYIIPNKWVGIQYFCNITGFSRSKVNAYIAAGLFEMRKNGRNTMINLEKFNSDTDSDVFEQMDLSNIYRSKDK